MSTVSKASNVKVPVSRRPQKPQTFQRESVTRDNDRVEHLERLAYWLDSAFRIPGLGLRFGVDAILDLLPGIGDALGVVASLFIFQAARQFGVPRITLIRMALNIFIDYVGGLLPFLGAVFDAYWKANLWNVALLKRHLDATPLAARKARRGDGLFVAAIIFVMLLLMAATFAFAIWLVSFVFQLLR